ncbi:MAG: hypothetical protein L7H10_05330 [Vulcanisaeta sp.]|nr:hypothetical protein [Vulcanisaeta sp.]MCG2870159.1 hypothetical protein [Vulcanisaeta sp.]MCG2887172.1 hypothetical protein [Vulcanisaeta sp.]
MLILIHGSLGLDYVLRGVLPSGKFLFSTICTDAGRGTGINVNLDPGISIRVAILWGRILNLSDDDARLLLDALLNSSTLLDAINYVLETYVDYNAAKLYYYLRIMSALDIWGPISSGCVSIPLIEPIKSLVSSIILAYVASNGIKGSLILSTDHVDDVKDALQEVRGLGDVYVVTSRMPRDLGIFDELVITTTGIPQETFGKLVRVSNGNSTEVIMTRLGAGITNNNFTRATTQLSDVELEILRTVNELGFTTMSSLIDMVSQSTGVAKNEVMKALIKVSSMNLVKIRYLADGRAVVTPSIPGLKLLISNK